MDGAEGQGRGASLSEAADEFAGPFPDVGEQEGLRRADGGVMPQRDVGADHNGAQLRQERNAAGFGSCEGVLPPPR